MNVLNFIINEIFGQGAIFLALVAMIGLILQKKPFSEIVRGSMMTAIGFFVLSQGTGIITGSLVIAITYIAMYFILAANGFVPGEVWGYAGGIRGCIAGAALSDIIMVFLVGFGSYFFGNTINNWMLVYGGQDFSLWGMLEGLLARLIG